jgi:lipopolysaccharide export system permease protein
VQILTRYLLARYLRTFLATLVLLLLAVVIGDLLLDLSDLLEQGEQLGLGSAVLTLALKTPARYLSILIPVASFAAAFLTLGLASRSLEVIAMKAGGVSPLRAALPVLVAALALSGVSFALNETFVLRANRILERIDRGSDAEEISVRRGSFWFQTGRTIYNVREGDPSTRTLRGVTVLELDERGHLTRSVHAEKARVLTGANWVLEGAIVRTFDTADRGAPPHEERAPELAVTVSGRSEKVLLDERAATLSLGDLREAIGARDREGVGSQHFRALFQERVSDPLTVLLFALLAIPLGLYVEEKKTLAVPALQGVILLVIFFFVRSFGSTLASQGVAPPEITPWAIFAAFAVLGAVRLSQVPR